MISKETATDIALVYREIENGQKLLEDVEKTISQSAHHAADIRDVFGRRADGLQLGVPSGERSHTLFNVPWGLAQPVIRAHLAECRSRLEALNEVARAELDIKAAP